LAAFFRLRFSRNFSSFPVACKKADQSKVQRSLARPMNKIIGFLSKTFSNSIPKQPCRIKLTEPETDVGWGKLKDPNVN
jgi:hypothetical protein